MQSNRAACEEWLWQSSRGGRGTQGVGCAACGWDPALTPGTCWPPRPNLHHHQWGRWYAKQVSVQPSLDPLRSHRLGWTHLWLCRCGARFAVTAGLPHCPAQALSSLRAPSSLSLPGLMEMARHCLTRHMTDVCFPCAALGPMGTEVASAFVPVLGTEMTPDPVLNVDLLAPACRGHRHARSVLPWSPRSPGLALAPELTSVLPP